PHLRTGRRAPPRRATDTRPDSSHWHRRPPGPRSSAATPSMSGFSTEQYSGSSQFVLIESSSVNPLMRPRLWIRIASLAALLAAAWLLLIPRTALYSVDDEGRPQDVRAKWSWSYSGRDGNVTMIQIGRAHV